MNKIEKLKRLIDSWRHRVLPPTAARVARGQDAICARLDALQTRLDQVERTMSQTIARAIADNTLSLEQTIARAIADTALSLELQGEILTVLRLLEPKKVVGYAKTRVGSDGDGGYVLVDDFTGISHALSFGVSDDDNWDLAIAQSGIPVEQFDHTIERAPSDHPLLHFHRKMISAEAEADTATLPDLVAEHSQLDAPDLILKIDIDGSEWDVFDHAPEATLAKLAQIACEFHDLSHLKNAQFRSRADRVFEKLSRHFAPVHVHANNWGGLGLIERIPIPDVLEVTYANRLRYGFVESHETFPTPLDAPNSKDAPDIALGGFRF